MQPQDLQISLRKLRAVGKTFGIMLGWLFTCASAPAQYNTTVDNFYPEVAWPCTLAVQRDGKILVGGLISVIDFQTRLGLGRLFPDGTLDPVYDPNIDTVATASPVYPRGELSMVIQPDDKLLVAGSFTHIGGGTYYSIGRLNPDGTPDTTFNAGATGGYAACLALQPDGKILVGGTFTQLDGQPCNCIGRLNPDGSRDTGFNSSVLGKGIYSMALQPDGKVVIGGAFTNILGQSQTNIGRLNPDGTLDAAFNPQLLYSPGYVSAVAIQADNKILVGPGLQRLYPDGTSDTNFNANAGVPGQIYALQADGKIFVESIVLKGGSWSLPDIGRVNPDGTADNTFHPGFGGRPTIYGATVQVDGKTLIAGVPLSYQGVGGSTGSGLLRLNNTDPATQNLNFDGSTITWQRGGTSPEVWRTTFESSVDGTNWVMLGAGTRIPGGWQLTGVSVPANSKLRARGYVLGGFANASGWIAESMWPKVRPSLVVNGPISGFSTNGFGLKVTGTPGEIVVIDASTDLSSWTPVITNTLCSAPAYFYDWGMTNFQGRFYRARLQ